MSSPALQPRSLLPPTLLRPDTAAAAAVLSRHAQNPSAFLALNRDTQHFRVPGFDGLIAFRPAGRRALVQLGGVFAAPCDQDTLLAAFLRSAAKQRRRVVTVQLTEQDTALYARHGFTVNQLGANYARTLSGFSLSGKKHMQLRNKVSRARRAGVQVAEVGVDLPGSPALEDQLDALDAVWLRSKGRHVKELSFLVGERGGPAASLRRLFVARSAEGSVLAYVSFSPAYGRQAGWLHDLSRRDPAAPPGALEVVVVSAVERFRAEGAGYLHFGFTPFTGLAAEHDVPGGSRLAARIVRLLADHGSAVYPAADQLAYKHKWGPDVIQPEYIAFAGGVRPGAVWSLLRLTNAA